MNPLVTGILSFVTNTLPGILTGNSVSKEKSAQIQADLQKTIIEAATTQDGNILNNLNKQLDLNITEAAAGRLGWRNWLGKGLTIALLTNLFVPFTIKLIAACCYPFGVSPVAILHFGTLIPMFDTDMIMTILGGLLGLYGFRGIEKVKYNQNKK